MWPQMYFLDLQQLDSWRNGWMVEATLLNAAVKLAALQRLTRR